MYYDKNTWIFTNGQFAKAADTRIDLYSQTLHYGYGVFEGIRAYKTHLGNTGIFRAREHFERLELSAKALNLPWHWTIDELISASEEVCRLNGLQDAYIRPVVFAPANMGFQRNATSFITIQAWEMAPFLGEQLLRVMTSSFERPNPKAFKIAAKATGHYVNSILASQEAKAKGFDEALLKDAYGYIAEGPGANFFYEKDGVLFTPEPGNILPGITRATILDICKERGITVIEKQILPEELDNTDAAFFCGTAAEVIGIASLDNKPLTNNWDKSLSRKIQLAYAARVRDMPFQQLKMSLTA